MEKGRKAVLRERVVQALVGGVSGAGVVLLFAAARVTGLEDLDHLGSAVVGVLTVPLVALSFVLFRETQKTRLENSEPRIVVTVEPGRYFGFFEVVIENVGRGTAYDVRTKLEPDIAATEEGGTPASVGGNGVLSPAVLKPGQRFAQYVGKLDELDPWISRARCTSRGEDGRIHTHENAIDLRMYERIGQLGPDNYLHEISKHLESMARVLGRVSSNDRLRVDSFDTGDRGKEKARRTQQRRALRERMKPATSSAPPGGMTNTGSAGADQPDPSQQA